MKLIRRYICLLLATVLALGLLASCKKKGEENQSDDGGSVDAPVESVKIADGGTVNFSIIYPFDIADDVMESVASLYSAMVKRSNSGIVTMSEASESSYSKDSFEILIGDTGYAESDAVMSGIGYGDWIVRFEGNKLVIAAYSRVGLRKGITNVIQTFKSGATDDGSITVAGDLCIKGTYNEVVNNLPAYDSLSSWLPVTADEGQETAIAHFKGTNVSEYEAYLDKLSKNGYTLYTSNKIVDNRFATYTNGEYIVHAAWYPLETSARVTIERGGELFGLERDNVWTPVNGITTSLAQIGLATPANEYSTIGMAYCYQLADGSFIVIDGGFTTDGDRIYDYMKAKAPNGDVRVAAWILTHNDGDHYAAFVRFVSKHVNDVKFDYVVKNMPASDTYLESGATEDVSTHSMADMLEGCKVVKVHTGMKLFLRNAEIEFLGTIDNILPDTLDIFNNSSLIFTVTVEGERALFTGDAGDFPAAIALKNYGDYLKSDIYQIAHHGRRNSTGLGMSNMENFCETVDAELVLWPAGDEFYLNVENEGDGFRGAEFLWNIAAMKSARETWIAGGDYITVFELPYRFYSAYRFDPENPNPVPVTSGEDSDGGKLNFREAAGDVLIGNVDWSDGR